MKFLITDIEEIPGITHGFFTRDADRPAVARALDINVVMAKQVHGARVVAVTDPWHPERPPEADGLVTTERNLGVAVVTADCAPVLFAARKAGVIGAAHAGWRGALGGVLEATVAAMGEFGAAPEDIEAAIGPCIGPASYEVTLDFQVPFIAQAEDNRNFFTPGREGRLMFDLPGYVSHRLKLAGVGKVHDTKQDTVENEGAFCSYRRSTLRGEADYGRQISVIALK